MSHFYDRHGMPISLERWAELFNDLKNRVVASDYINDIWISTVWLGLDHRWGPGPPLIFETMVFNSGVHNFQSRWHDIEMRRYTTEADAIEGHLRILELVRVLEFADNTETGETDDTGISTDDERDASLHDHGDRGGDT
jgi:hypothetical protein